MRTVHSALTTSTAVPPSARDSLVNWKSYASALAVSLALTLLATPLRGRFEPVNLVMLFLLGVVIVAARWGRGPAVLAALVNVMSFDFFFVPPFYTFAVADVQYVFTFAVMLAVGLLIAQLTANLRYQARIASYREDRAHNLFEMARELSAALTAERVAQIADSFVDASFHAQAALLLLDAHNELKIVSGQEAEAPDVDLAIGRWCVDRAEVAGMGTETFPAAADLYVPLTAPMRTRGVLVIKPGNASLWHVPEQRRVLDTFAALIAIALERLHFVTVAQDTSLKMESERLRNSLLAALSHDLRTPLTALVGSADTLAMKLAASGSPHTRDSREIREQAQRTAQLVDNLLEMAKLQSGGVTLRKDWQLMEELAGAAIRSLGSALSAHRVVVDLPEELPLVRCDAILIERVLVNLLQNASKYTPAGTRVGIIARAGEGQQMVVSVWDQGPGLPPGQEEALFEKFARGDKESVIPGVGLGLAICRAIIEAHGGRIWAESRPQGGAVVSFSLPLEAAPSLEAEPEGS